MDINNDSEETQKLKKLFYSATQENIELALNIAKGVDNQQFITFYEQWRSVYHFQQRYQALGWTKLNDLAPLIAAINDNGLYLANLGLETLPDYFAVIGEICEAISLDFNNFFKIPACLKNFKQLQSLNLVNTCLQVLPDWLFELEKLEYLYLDKNFIEYLSPNIQLLQNLKELYFVQNKVCTLPPTLAFLPHLQALRYGANQMNTAILPFPEPILVCQKLRYLCLENLYLQEISTKMSDLIHLVELHICNCIIEKNDFEFQNLPKLQSLSLTGQNIKAIPDSVFACEPLRELNLSGSQIDKIPLEISQLRNLEKLYLQNTLINSNSFEFWEAQLRRWLPNVEVEWGLY